MTFHSPKATTLRTTGPRHTGPIAVGPFSYALNYLRAYTAMRKFRKLDAYRLADIGLTQAEADAMTIADFMEQQQR